MTNYKNWGHSRTTGYLVDIPYNKDTDLFLMLLGTGSTIENQTLHNLYNNTNYIVPASRKFIILRLHTYTDASKTTYLNYGSTLDSSSGSAQIIAAEQGLFATANPIHKEVPAGNYITANSTGNNSWTIRLYGVETDA